MGYTTLGATMFAKPSVLFGICDTTSRMKTIPVMMALGIDILWVPRSCLCSSLSRASAFLLPCFVREVIRGSFRGYSGCVSKFWPKDFVTKDYIPKVPPHYELAATSRAPALQRSTWALLLQLAERKGHCSTRGRRVLLLSELHKGTFYNAFPIMGYATGHNTGSAR